MAISIFPLSRRRWGYLLLLLIALLVIYFCLNILENKRTNAKSLRHEYQESDVIKVHLSDQRLASRDKSDDFKRLFYAEEPVATISVNMAEDSIRVFDAERVYKLFCSCRGEGDILSIDCYSNAYEELCKLFRVFGTIFSFVTSDVEEKIGILRDYRKAEDAEEYKTVQSMLEFEVKNNLTKNKRQPSGSRTLLRLHRALEFISAFLLKLKEADNHAKFSTLATKAYDTTLAKHHPWLIKKAVHVALYMIPSRPELLKKMGVEDNEKGMNAMGDLVKELQTIFEITEKLYEKDDLLDLP